MIQIKTLFGEWKEVTKEQAKDCIMLRVYNLSCKHKKNTIKIRTKRGQCPRRDRV